MVLKGLEKKVDMWDRSAKWNTSWKSGRKSGNKKEEEKVNFTEVVKQQIQKNKNKGHSYESNQRKGRATERHSR